MSDSFENDENLDVLQNIEFAIVSVLEDYPDMDDSDAMNAFDVLIKDFRDIERGRKPKANTLTEATGGIFTRVRNICLWRMRPEPALVEPPDAAMVGDPLPESQLLPPEAISRCLKKIRKSMDRWHGVGGRRGYLEFISKYFPPGS